MARDVERIDVKGMQPKLYRAKRTVEVVDAGRGNGRAGQKTRG